MSRQQAQRSDEIIQHQLRHMVRRPSMPWDLLAGVPIRDGEMEGWTFREMHNCHTPRLFSVIRLFEHNHGCVALFARELGDFPYRELIAVSMRRAADVLTVGEEVSQDGGFVVKSRVY